MNENKKKLFTRVPHAPACKGGCCTLTAYVVPTNPFYMCHFLMLLELSWWAFLTNGPCWQRILANHSFFFIFFSFFFLSFLRFCAWLSLKKQSEQTIFLHQIFSRFLWLVVLAIFIFNFILQYWFGWEFSFVIFLVFFLWGYHGFMFWVTCEFTCVYLSYFFSFFLLIDFFFQFHPSIFCWLGIGISTKLLCSHDSSRGFGRLTW